MSDSELIKEKLLFAVKYWSVKEVQNYLDLGIDCNCTDVNTGDSALHIASRLKDGKSFVQLLLERGCNPNLKNLKGKTALHVAVSQISLNPDVIRLLLDSGCPPDNETDIQGDTPLSLFESMHGIPQRFDENRIKTKTLLREYAEYWQMGLPIEVKDFDQKSANVFTSLLKQEGYLHYEARVMLAGEQETGKTTIARYLVGKGPTKNRISTDGIDLYNGLSFIDRESEEWMPGKQGFTLSEVVISRSLRQSDDDASNMNARHKLTHGENIISSNKSSVFAKEIQDNHKLEECDSKPYINSQKISTTSKVVKDSGIIAKLKKLFGVKKDVTEIKVSITKDKFLKESMKAGKKKIHQKKISPVIIWDFGGQDVFYSTHQTFLTYRAIYLIVLDGRRTLDDPCPFELYLPGKSGGKTARDYLRFWINTIVTYCKGSGPGFPKIMIVLTHKDKLKAINVDVESRRQHIFQDIQQMFSGSPLLSHLVIEEQIFVNARNQYDPEMAKIKQIIIEQAKEQPTWGQKLPKCFIPLELEFESLLSRKIPLITMEQLKKINSLQPVRPLTEQELKVFLKFQHSFGRILYFDEPNLDQHLILSPTHLIDAFKSIVTDRRFCEGDRKRQESWDLMSKKGIIEKKSIQDIWKKKKYNKFQDHKEYLLGVMNHLDILVEPKRYDKSQQRIPVEFYYVASMVRTSDETHYLMSASFAKRNIAIAFSTSSSMIPPALSFRFISYCLSIFAVKKYGQYDEDEMLFHRSAIFSIDQSLDMCVNCDDEFIVVRLVHSQNRTLIMRDLASSIRDCLAVALEKISQLYVKTSSTDYIANKSSFNLSLCCSSFDDPCFMPMLKLEDQDDSWICPKHGIEHNKDMMSSWEFKKDEIQCGTACPVTDTEFLDQTPSDIHLRRLSMQYSINETKELAMHLGMDYQTWDDMYVTFGEEPVRLKFEVLRRPIEGNHLSFNDIRNAVELGKIRTIHSLCKVVRGNPIDFDEEPAKWDLIPTEEHLDRVAPLVGNNSLPFLVELGLEFRTWEEIKYRQTGRDLVKLNRHILQEWKTNFCSLHNIRPSLRDIGKAFKNIGKNTRVIENVLADLF